MVDLTENEALFFPSPYAKYFIVRQVHGIVPCQTSQGSARNLRKKSSILSISYFDRGRLLVFYSKGVKG